MSIKIVREYFKKLGIEERIMERGKRKDMQNIGL